MEFRFSGSSDDTFGSNIDDHDNCASGAPIIYRLTHGDDRLLVWGQYAPAETGAGGWVIGISPDDDVSDRGECRDLPEWPMTYRRTHRPYSAELVITAPEGTVQTLVYPTLND